LVDEGVDRMHQVDAVPAEAGLNQYSSFNAMPQLYNENGSLTSSESGTDYVYDSTNRLSEIRKNGALISQYAYDASNRRVMSYTLLEGFTLFYYDGWKVLEDYDPLATPPAPRRQYVDGPGIDEHYQIKNYESAGAPEFYYHCNDQGSVGALSDASGAAVEHYEYSMLGKPTVTAADRVSVLSNSPSGNRYSFQGRRFEFESGLYHFRNRYYSPLTGEFIVVDPTGLWRHGQGTGYSAFGGDPWNSFDPFVFKDWVPGWVHDVADAAVMVPLLGTAPDLVNAALYALDGDKEGCAWSLGAAIPVAGWFSTGGKWGKNIGKAAAGGGKKAAKEAAKKAAKATRDALKKAAKNAGNGGLRALGRKGKGKGVREVVGDAPSARKFFDDLRGSSPVEKVKPGVFKASGPNGKDVTFRASSKSGPPTVDVHGIESGVRKIKFVAE